MHTFKLKSQVYSGLIRVDQAPGWVEIALDRPFFYGMKNHIVIAVFDPTTNNYSNLDKFFCIKANISVSLVTNTLVDLNKKVILTGSTVFSYPNVSLAFTGIDYYFDISPLTASASVQTGGGYQYEFMLNNRGFSIWSTSGYAVAVGQEKTLLSYQNSN